MVDVARVVDEVSQRVVRELVAAGVTRREGTPGRKGFSRISADAVPTGKELARLIDHTLLKPEATREDVQKLAQEALAYGFATVCVSSVHVATAAEVLRGAQTVPISVVGFPSGASLSSVKAFEAQEAIQAGAQEIDMVIALGALKSRDHVFVFKDIQTVVEASGAVPVKVILETSQLTLEEKIAGCVLSKAAGAAFVKTSTGFAAGGATAEDVALMRSVVGDELGVKASGGIRSTEDALKMIQAGANRIGASASVAIVTGKKAGGGY